MTLKVRLMTMMIVLVMGVLALQFLLTEREKRELTNEIARLGSEVSSSARDVSVRAFAASRSGTPLRDVLTTLEGLAPGDHPPGATVRFVRTEAFSGTLERDVTPGAHGPPRHLRSALDESLDVIVMLHTSSSVDSLRELVWQEALEQGHSRRVIESPAGRWSPSSGSRAPTPRSFTSRIFTAG